MTSDDWTECAESDCPSTGVDQDRLEELTDNDGWARGVEHTVLIDHWVVNAPAVMERPVPDCPATSDDPGRLDGLADNDGWARSVEHLMLIDHWVVKVADVIGTVR